MWILNPPRANVRAWMLGASLFALQSLLTLAALAWPSMWLRISVACGAVALGWAGYSAIHSTLASTHFEGSAVVLGGMLVLQAAVTIAAFASPARLRTA